MYTESTMPRKRDPNVAVANISARLFGEEADRWEEVWRRAINRNPHVDKTDVIKFLLGLPTTKENVLTEEDRRYFQGLTKKARNRIAAVPMVKGNQDENKRGSK